MCICLGNWQGYDITSLVTAKLRRGRRAFSISGMNPTLSKFNNAFLELQQDNVSICDSLTLN